MPTISVSPDSNKTFKSRVEPSQLIQNQAEDHRLKGNSAFQANNLAEALDFYSKSLKLWEQACTYSNRSLIFFKLKDYEAAINSSTALLMKVHTSNYEIRGFTNSVPEEELSQLARQKNLCFVSDLGSGTLVDLSQFGLPHEPTVQETLGYGADIVTFSGDKLLGGPQAGIIVGNQDLIHKIKSNPLKRALRVDKITLAALVEILNLYRDPHRLTQRIPLLADLSRPIDEINSLAERLLPIFQNRLGARAAVVIEDCKSQIGSGALPLDLLASKAIVISPIAKKGNTDATLQQLAREFRELPIPVIGRINDGKLIFDLRCLENETQLCSQLSKLST